MGRRQEKEERQDDDDDDVACPPGQRPTLFRACRAEAPAKMPTHARAHIYVVGSHCRAMNERDIGREGQGQGKESREREIEMPHALHGTRYTATSGRWRVYIYIYTLIRL